VRESNKEGRKRNMLVWKGDKVGREENKVGREENKVGREGN